MDVTMNNCWRDSKKGLSFVQSNKYFRSVIVFPSSVQPSNQTLSKMRLPITPLALLSLFTTALAIPLPDIETRQARTAKLTFYGVNYKDYYYVDVPDGQSVKISRPTIPLAPSPTPTFA